MNWHEIISYTLTQWNLVSPFEKIAVILSVAEVLLSYRNNVWLYPSGIISCGLFIWLFLKAGLYADSGLSVYYLVMSFWGWYLWVKRRKNNVQLPISLSTQKDWIIVALICAGGFSFIYFILKNYTDSTVPVMDAFVSATAWSGMWLLAKRKVENWVMLNVSNIVAIPLLYYKGMPLTALLTAFLFAVAVMGYFKWLKIMKEEQAANKDMPEKAWHQNL